MLRSRSVYNRPNPQTKNNTLLNQFLTKSVPEIHITEQDLGAIAEIEIEMVIDDTTPLAGNCPVGEQTFNSSLGLKTMENRLLKLDGEVA